MSIIRENLIDVIENYLFTEGRDKTDLDLATAIAEEIERCLKISLLERKGKIAEELANYYKDINKHITYAKLAIEKQKELKQINKELDALKGE